MMKRDVAIGILLVIAMIVLVTASVSNFGSIVSSGDINSTRGNISQFDSTIIRMQTDVANHNITDNATCMIIKGDAAILEIC